MLAPLEADVRLRLALGALNSQGNLLGRLRLLVEHRLGLATIARLLPVVPPLACGQTNTSFGQPH